jgi:multisubunit Na+/H+ antiporter MnhG subunit
VAGRLVAAIVMLVGIALVAIVTAAITSTFVARATSLQGAALVEDEKREDVLVQERFDDLSARLDRLETLVRTVAER